MGSDHNEPRYAWVEDWPEPGPDAPPVGFAHTSLVVTAAGEIAYGHSLDRALLFARPEGGVVRTLPVDGVTELHGLALVEQDGAELLWIADPGTKERTSAGRIEEEAAPAGGQVVAIDLAGARQRVLDRPSATPDGAYAPTSVVVDEPRFGGSGDVWVADGYGADLVHRFDAGGRHVATLSGEEGAGRFRCPHGLLIDRRGLSPELYVADRRNARLQVYDLDGRFKRTVGDGVLVGPTMMAVSGELLLVTDLVARRLTLLGPDDELVAHLFGHPEPLAWGEAHDEEGWPEAWPNARSAEGAIVPPAIEPGCFHCPHGVAVDARGNVYVTEHLLGGRTVKLAC